MRDFSDRMTLRFVLTAIVLAAVIEPRSQDRLAHRKPASELAKRPVDARVPPARVVVAEAA